MRLRYVLTVGLACWLSVTWTFGQSPCDGYPADKTWEAEIASGLKLGNANVTTGFPGWGRELSSCGETCVTSVLTTVGGLEAQRDTVQGVGGSKGKLKYRSDIAPASTDPDWTVTGTNELSITWQLYVSAAADNMPAVLLGNGVYGIRLQFSPTIGQYCAGISGWRTAAWCGLDTQTKITGGGKLNPIGNREPYLPMAMNEWHTLRVDLHTNGTFDAWIDGGGSDWKHVTGQGVAFGGQTCGAKNYVQFGQISDTEGLHEFATACLAWGEGDVQIPDPPPSGTGNEEICDNEIDDADPDTDIDCLDSDCDCNLAPENTLEACSNGIDDDGDEDVDCADTDCDAIAHCADGQPQYVLTMVRQVGDDNMSGWENTGVYFSVYDEEGNPLNGVTITDPLNCFSAVTAVGESGQGGHARYIPAFGGELVPQRPYFGDTSLYWYVSADSPAYGGGVVDSEATPVMYGWLPRPNGGPEGHYAWQVEFMRKSQKTNAGTFDPLNKVYIHDDVQMNTPAFDGQGNPRANDFQDKDTVGVALSEFGFGSAMWGQTFLVPAGVDRIVSARVHITFDNVTFAQYELSIHPIVGDNPPDDESDIGPAIGPAKLGPAGLRNNHWWAQMVVWPTREPDPDPDPENDVAVEVTPGQEYFLKVRRVDSGLFTPYRTVDARVTSDGVTSTGNEGSGVEDCPGAPDPDPMYTGDFYKYAPDAHGVCYRRNAGGNLIGDDVGCYHEFEENPPFILYTSQFYDMKAYIVGGSFGPLDPCSVHDPVFDTDDSGKVDGDDYGAFQACATIPGVDPAVFEALSQECRCMDLNGDQAIDQQDFGAFQLCYSGAADADPTCDD